MFKKKKGREDKKDAIELVLLRVANNNFELDLIRGMLEENNIPFIVKESGIGAHMKIVTGQTLYGADILVERTFYEKAKEILDSITWDD